MFQTSVFTPVLGSCTSVTVNNKMTVQEVIKTLLDKFKVGFVCIALRKKLAYAVNRYFLALKIENF